MNPAFTPADAPGTWQRSVAWNPEAPGHLPGKCRVGEKKRESRDLLLFFLFSSPSAGCRVPPSSFSPNPSSDPVLVSRRGSRRELQHPHPAPGTSARSEHHVDHPERGVAEAPSG